MRRVLIVMVTMCAAVIGTAGSASAQTATAGSKVELTAGYQFQRLGLSDGLNMPVGGFADITFGGNQLQGVVQVGAAFKSETHSFTSGGATFTSESRLSMMRAMAGIRGSSSGTGTTAFGHVMGGVIRFGASSKSSSGEFDEHETKFAVQLGTGVNIPTGARAHVRLGVDYQRVFVEGGGNVYLATIGFGFRLK